MRRTLAWLGVGFAVVFPTVVTISYFVFTDQDSSTTQQTRYAVLKVIQFAFPVLWVVSTQRGRFQVAWPKRDGSWLGLAFGLTVTLLMVAAYFGLMTRLSLFASANEAVEEKLMQMGLDSVAKFVAVGVFYALVHSLLEEYYWRWFVFGQMRDLLPRAAAIGLSSVAFALHHVILLVTYFGWLSWATWVFTLSVVVGGLFWAWLYDRSGSLIGPWLGHAAVDAGLFGIGLHMAKDVLLG